MELSISAGGPCLVMVFTDVYVCVTWYAMSLDVSTIFRISVVVQGDEEGCQRC